jgi:RNA polymerase sigma-70 factor (ECF subfamily)
MEDLQAQHLRLLSATALGDQAAFAQLYKISASKLYAVSLQMLRHKDLAEDAVQEAYIRIWHNAGEYQQEKGMVLTWMISIVRYRALDMLRATKSRRENCSDDLPEEGEDHHSPELDLYQQRDRSSIENCMDALTPQQREALQMAYFLGMTHQEVCTELDLPLGSVKSWIRRGLDQLKRCLAI